MLDIPVEVWNSTTKSVLIGDMLFGDSWLSGRFSVLRLGLYQVMQIEFFDISRRLKSICVR